jgi:AraC-like DNA-binding protein
VVDHNRATRPGGHERTTVYSLDQVVTGFPLLRAAGVLGRHGPFSLTNRIGHLGPITVLEHTFGVDTWIKCAEERPYYQVNVPIAGQIELVHRNSSITAGPGRGAVCVPEGELSVPRWTGGGRTIAFRVDRHAVEDVLSEAVGRPITSQIAFKPSISTTKGAARSWMHMLMMLNHELFQPDSAVSHPLVAKPFIDSLIGTLLLAADHPYRGMLAAETGHGTPRVIRAAVEIIESEPHLPLTVSSLAARSHVSARALQQAFRRHTGVSPMAYLRQVRLRRAHQELLEADPSAETVASIATRWGFSNPGRFAAVYAARYGETPGATLRRLGSQRIVRQRG